MNRGRPLAALAGPLLAAGCLPAPPPGARRTGTGARQPRDDQEWQEREDLVFAALRVARRRWHIDPDRVALTGFSQRGRGAWTIGARPALPAWILAQRRAPEQGR